MPVPGLDLLTTYICIPLHLPTPCKMHPNPNPAAKPQHDPTQRTSSLTGTPSMPLPGLDLLTTCVHMFCTSFLVTGLTRKSSAPLLMHSHTASACWFADITVKGWGRGEGRHRERKRVRCLTRVNLQSNLQSG